MNNNSFDPNLYPYEYPEYLKNPYRYSVSTQPMMGKIAVTTVYGEKFYNSHFQFILRIDDITTGTPKQIVSKTGSFWRYFDSVKTGTIAFITLDGTEVLIVDSYGKIYRYALIHDNNQQP